LLLALFWFYNLKEIKPLGLGLLGSALLILTELFIILSKIITTQFGFDSQYVMLINVRSNQKLA
jgi:hypothetical protein